MSNPFSAGGVITPAVTPLRPDGTVDVQSTVRLVRAQAAAGVTGVLLLGSTGEGPFLGLGEAQTVVGCAAATGVPVIANCSALGTADAVQRARLAAEAGASAILAPPPSGFPITQDELRLFYEQVAAATSLPTYAYHVPSRTPTLLTPETLGLLVRDGVLAGVKDSSGDLDNHRSEIRHLAGTRGTAFTGSETCIDLAVHLGFVGSVPGLANVYPRAEVELLALAREGHGSQAAAAQEAVVARLPIYFGTAAGHTFTAVAVGALKTALVQAGVIEHATLARPFTTPDLTEHVAAHLAAFPADIEPA